MQDRLLAATTTRPPTTGRCALSQDDPPNRGRREAVREALRHRRERLRKHPALNTGYRVALALIGIAALLVGIVLIPYPGPGWLIVFASLLLLATEFHWARRVYTFAKKHYEAWSAWMQRQHPGVQLAAAAAAGAALLVLLWLLNLFGTAATWLDLPWPWLHSPLFKP